MCTGVDAERLHDVEPLDRDGWYKVDQAYISTWSTCTCGGPMPCPHIAAVRREVVTLAAFVAEWDAEAGPRFLSDGAVYTVQAV